MSDEPSVNRTTEAIVTQPFCRTYLSDEDVLVVNRTLARAIGLNESIVLRQIFYWLRENKKRKSTKHFHDECWWTFNTYAEWQEENFDFWSYDTVRRAFIELEALGLLFSSTKYNSRAGDQTKWYTVNYGAYDAYMTLWLQHGQPRAMDGSRNPAYKAFLEDWEMHRPSYTNMASCKDQYGKLQTPIWQVAMSVTRDYTETNTEKKEEESAAAFETTEAEEQQVFEAYKSLTGVLLVSGTMYVELTKAMKRFPAAWIVDAMTESETHNKRSWAYALKILERWAVEGKDSGKPKTPQKKTVGTTVDSPTPAPMQDIETASYEEWDGPPRSIGEYAWRMERDNNGAAA